MIQAALPGRSGSIVGRGFPLRGVGRGLLQAVKRLARSSMIPSVTCGQEVCGALVGVVRLSPALQLRQTMRPREHGFPQQRRFRVVRLKACDRAGQQGVRVRRILPVQKNPPEEQVRQRSEHAGVRLGQPAAGAFDLGLSFVEASEFS